MRMKTICKSLLGVVPILFAGCVGDYSCITKKDEEMEFTAADGVTTLKCNWEQNKNNDSNAPLLIMIHGGAWREYSKDHEMFYYRHPKVQAVFENFNIASINYRLWKASSNTTEAVNPFPAARDDVLAFIEYIKKDAQRKPSKICLLGQSAGAHIAATVAIASLADESFSIDCLVNHAGFYDFDNIGGRLVQSDAEKYRSDYLKSSGADPDSALELSPMDMLDANYTIPTLVTASPADLVVNNEQSINWVDAINSYQAGLAKYVDVEERFVLEPHNGHFLVLSSNSDCKSSYAPQHAQAIANFVGKYLSE